MDRQTVMMALFGLPYFVGAILIMCYRPWHELIVLGLLMIVLVVGFCWFEYTQRNNNG